MTAIAVGRAMALGKIRSLDQPVADFIPEWRTDERRRLILVRHLLDMRSGFLPQSMSPDPAHILNRAYLHPRHDDIIITVQKYERGVGGNRGHGSVPRKGKSKNAL